MRTATAKAVPDGAHRGIAPKVTLVEALADATLFGDTFGAPSFWTWFVIAKLIDGQPLKGREIELYSRYTGRSQLPNRRVRRMLLLAGRRAGKDRFFSAVSIWRAALCADWSKIMSAGELGVCLLLGADKRQARILRNYAEGLLRKPVLAREVARRTDEVIEFKNGSVLEIGTNDARLIRGRSAIAVLGSEVCHWKTAEDSASSDVEVISAAEPSMSMCPDGGLLVLASSVGRRRGYMFDMWRQNYGRDRAEDDELVWLAPSRGMNPVLPERVINQALKRDPWHAKAEYLSEWRDESSGFIDRDAVEAAVDVGARERLPAAGVGYCCFVDPASGAGPDSMALAIAHRERDGRVVLDVLREIPPRFSPSAAVAELVALVRRYRITRVYGDRFGGEFVREMFRPILYELSEQTKSEIYQNTLPLINSGMVRLLDIPKLVTQLCQLERKVGSASRETIDHPKGAAFHDDLANAAAGALLMASSKPQLIVPASVVAAGRRFAPPNPWSLA